MPGINIIGDVAGQFRALKALIAKMPKDEVLLVGDLVDRGPSSKQVVAFVRQGHARSLYGNHEDMMLDFVLDDVKEYQEDIWLINGGGTTIRSYFPELRTDDYERKMVQERMREDCQWIRENLPRVYRRSDGLIASHAPLTQAYPECTGRDAIWNRSKPRKIVGQFQVHGHNSRSHPLWYTDLPTDEKEAAWGVNVDTSAAAILTGIHWPSKEIFQQEYF